MLIQQKILTKILFAGLLLSFKIDAIATIPGLKGFQDKVDFAFPVQNDVQQSTETDQDKNTGIIEFQVNSEITYLNINQFIKAESKQAFLGAWTKSQESHRLSNQTDSLRKAYTASPDDQKDKIAALILEGEKKIMALNEEIPALYEKARIGENLYWQSAAPDEKMKFIEKIRSYRDSIQQVKLAFKKQLAENKSVPDTIIYYRADKLNEVAAEPVSTAVYRIQVGTFKTKLPESIARAIKKLEVLRKVDVFKDEKGVTFYTTVNLKTYKEALTLQTQVKLEGMKNATVVAYKNGKQITLDEAKKLSNETNVKP